MYRGIATLCASNTTIENERTMLKKMQNKA
jgi:hypothetical protein